MASNFDGDSNSDFACEEWASRFELASQTISALLDNGFETAGNLQTVNLDRINAYFGDLSLSQRFALADATEELRTSHDKPRTDRPNAFESRTEVRKEHTQQRSRDRIQDGTPTLFQRCQDRLAEGNTLPMDDMAALLSGRPHQDSYDDAGQTYRGMYDILSGGIRNTVKTKPPPFRDIRDFVSLDPRNKNKDSDDNSTVSLGSFEIKVKDGKIPLDRLSMPQYTEGAMRILRELVDKDGYDTAAMLDYTGYITKIASFAQVFEWHSVVQYDLEFRKRQAQQGFTWQTDDSFLMQLFLRAKVAKKQNFGGYGANTTNANTTNANTSHSARTKLDTRTGKPICERFNGRNGCTLRVCNYAHVCFTCNSATHGDFNHRRSSPTASSEQAKND
jgi:hypothetical protein